MGAVQYRPPLVDRREETQRLAAFLTDAGSSGAALVLTGAPGHGKTAVLEEAAAMAVAMGMRVVRVEVSQQGDGASSGVELLAAQIAGRPRGLSKPGDRLATGNDLLQGLALAAADGPLLVAIDDADRLDEAGVAVLTFVGRRLASTRAALLAASTSGVGSLLRRQGLPELHLPPLATPDAEELLERHAPGLSPQVVDRVLAEASGNPLALVELPTVLTDRQRQGLDPLPTVLPMTPRLRALHEPAFRALSPEAFDLLVAVAVARPGDLGVFASSGSTGSGAGLSGLAGHGVHVLRELEEQRLVEVQQDGQSIGFPAPLTRHAVVHRASSDQLRRAHQRLSAALSSRPDRQVWHTAAVVEGPDSEVSRKLEELAYDARRAGDPDEAMVCLLRAAELSATPGERSARTAAAAQLQMSVAGDLRGAARLLDEASRNQPSPGESVATAAAQAQLMLVKGAHLVDARLLLAAALDGSASRAEDAKSLRVEPPDPSSFAAPDIAAALQLMFYVCLLEARPEPWRVYHRLVEQHGRRRSSSLTMVDGLLPDLTRTTASTLRELDHAVAKITEVAADPDEVILVGIAAFHLDRLADCRAAVARVAEDARAGRSLFLGAQAMLRLSLDDCMTGQFVRSERLAQEALSLAISLGHAEHLWPYELPLALVAAMRGERADVDSLTRSMVEWAVPRGALLVEHHSAHVRCLAALGEADFESAFQLATSISPAGTLAAHTSVAVWSCLDLVEAAVHTGRDEQAQAHTRALLESGIAQLSPRLALRVAAAVAMTATDEDARSRFAEALAIRHVDRWPFETARVQLAYGDRLRRLRDPAAAEEHLWAAYETFRRLGAREWTKRAAEQLRAVGTPVAPAPRTPVPTLTGRDREIAALAASGLSNREIGERLFLSPRTVGSRLYRIFPRLGVTSRAALRDALDRQEEDPAGTVI